MSRRIAPRRGPSNDPQIEDGVHIADLPIDIFARKIEVTPCGHRRWKALCPCHGDTNASLSISETEGGDLLMMCHGCHATGDQVAEALGLPAKYLFASEYAREHNSRGVVLTNDSRSKKPEGEKVPDHKAMETVLAQGDGDMLTWAAHLGVHPEDLELLGCVQFDDMLCTPEVDHRRRVVGVAKRWMHSSSKKMEYGSVRGLYIPSFQVVEHGPLFITEGMSDTAALLFAGVKVVGRSQALTRPRQVRWLVMWIQRHHHAFTPVVVIGDNDDTVGWRGARELAADLKAELPDYTIEWAVPWFDKRRKYKDVREQILAGDWQRGLVTNPRKK